MVTIATDTFITSMQPASRLKRGPTPSHMESPTWFLQVLNIGSLFSVSSPSYSSLEPSKPSPEIKQDLNMSWDASSQVVFLFQRKFSLLERASIFPPRWLWCPTLNGIRVTTWLFIKNFLFWWSPHFFASTPPNYTSPIKAYDIHPPSTPWNKSRDTWNHSLVSTLLSKSQITTSNIYWSPRGVIQISKS